MFFDVALYVFRFSFYDLASAATRMGLSALARRRACTALDSLGARRGAYFFTVDVVRYMIMRWTIPQ
jgi:hypothetical protein